MGVTTTLPSSVQLNAVGDTYTETGETVIVGNSGTTTFSFDETIITLKIGGLTYHNGGQFQQFQYNISLGSASITAAGNGSTTLELISGNPSVAPTVSIPITVGQVEDESYLNKRGLAHFWENIDEIKQDKMEAMTNAEILSIYNGNRS